MKSKTSLFSLKLSLFTTFFITLTLLGINHFSPQKIAPLFFIFLISIFIFVIIFLISQILLKRLISKKNVELNQKISLLSQNGTLDTLLTNDIDSLSKNLEKFAQEKQNQIKQLTLKEDYRREFLGNISHELKTPLFTVQGYLLTLSEGAVKDKFLRERYLNRANKAVDRLIDIIKNLDYITKLESDYIKLEKEPHNIIKLTKDVFELLEMEAHKKKITLAFDKPYAFPLKGIMDKKQMELVLINLIENSIKYGKTGGVTIVNFSTYDKEKILVEIKDNGIGISKKHIPRLFERFYRTDKARFREMDTEGGSGLGLSIVKHILEAHNQSVFVKSKPNEGTTFSFTIEKELMM